MVMVNVCIGFTFGITAKTVSPTSPLDVEATPAKFIGTSLPLLFASKTQVSERMSCQDMNEHLKRTRSAAVTSAHAFGAQ